MKHKLALAAFAAVATLGLALGIRAEAFSTPPDPERVHNRPHNAITPDYSQSEERAEWPEFDASASSFILPPSYFAQSPLVGVWARGEAVIDRTPRVLPRSQADGVAGAPGHGSDVAPPQPSRWRQIFELVALLSPFMLGGLTAGIDTKERSGEIVTIPVAAATHLYFGGLIAVNASGYAVAAADASGYRVVGRCEVEVDNSSGAAGDLSVQVKRGVFRYTNSSGDPIALADVGNMAYVETDAIVSKVGGTNKIPAGRIVDLDATGVWVDTRTVSASVTRIARATFDPSATSGDRTIGAHTLGVIIPSGAIITRFLYNVNTTFTSATDAATVAFHLQSAGDLLAAIAISDASNVLDAGLRAGKPGYPNFGADAAHDSQVEVAALFAATGIVLTADRTLTATVAVEALTAGKATLYVEYVI